MSTKQKQVTDNIHGTIYLSEMESEFIATPYFYRLHDIYQSSTVYMTFPSNRTKRYEHSLGTMELVSSMIFSAVSNADNRTTSKLFKELEIHFEQIIEILFEEIHDVKSEYIVQVKQIINEIIYGISTEHTSRKNANTVYSCLKTGIQKGGLVDPALDNYQYYPAGAGNYKGSEEYLQFFLYRCLLEALRVVALYHDVGHPPYSHIIESTLNEIYKDFQNFESENEYNKRNINDFLKIMKKYKEEEFVCEMLSTKKTCNKDEDLHEIVGASLLQWTIDEILPQLIEKVEGEHDKNIKVTKLLYYIVVAEFIMAIRMETNPVFESLHKLVDGIIDADRLDYIVRDSYNSGVDWGKIPYKRLINSSKLVALDDDYFVIAFPQKALDEITDLLLLRYKIYARINFHHGCVKSTITLQASVYKLAKNLLENKSAKNVINSEIELLWKALGRGAGDNKLRIIQWNDSWLISVLHSALVKLHDDKNLKDKNRELLENLEEFLLNKKRFYTLLKRGDDWKRFVDQVFLYADITDERLKELKNRECKKFIESDLCTEEVLDVPKHDAHDSLNRIEALKKIKRTGELEYLYYVLPIGNDNIEIEQILGNTLEGMLEEKKIVDYRIVENKGRGKTGLPSHKDKYNEIYFYDNKGDFHTERLENLEEQIEVLRRSIPWFYIYFVPCDNCKNINQLSDELFHVLAKSVANMLIRRYNELFPNNTIE